MNTTRTKNTIQVKPFKLKKIKIRTIIKLHYILK